MNLLAAPGGKEFWKPTDPIAMQFHSVCHDTLLVAYLFLVRPTMCNTIQAFSTWTYTCKG